MKFIHIADVHLGATPDSSFPWGVDREKEIWSTFHKVIEACNQEQAELLLISGDFFHRQPLIRELKEANYAFQKLKNTQVFIMAGNHDYLSARSNYFGFEWDPRVHMILSGTLEAIEYSELDTTVYGFSYPTRDIREALYDKVRPKHGSGYHILLAHGGEEKNIPINRRKLAEAGFDYIALGHIHKPEMINDRIAYAGSLIPLDKNEIWEHGYLLGELRKDSQGKTLIEVRFVPCSDCLYKRVTLTVTPETTNGSLLDQAKEAIKKMGTQHIYSFFLQGFRDETIRLDKEALKTLGRVIEVEDRTVPDYDFEQLYRENSDNILGLFIDRIKGVSNQSGNDIGQMASKEESTGTISREAEVAKKALYYGIEALLGRKA